jgi:hypothetical protein
MATLDDVADALYALKPDEFSAARDAEVKKARQDGDRDLAKEIGGLRKPTQSAWLINLLWRDQHDVMEQLFDLARELGRAQAEAAGPELRALATQRRQLESALLRRATELAHQEGVSVSEATAREAQETLSAALARPDVADEVRTGRLVKAASYAGFGAPSTPSAAPKPSPQPAEPKEPIDLRAAQRAREEREERQERERREAAERRAAQAQSAAETAKAKLDRATRAQNDARARRDDLRQQLRALREQLQRVESQVDEAERQTDAAERERDQAEAAHSSALKELAAAERALRE